MDLVTSFIPLFVWLNVDVTNDMDVCKFYSKFAQKRSHSENRREKYFIIAYLTIFNQRCFVFKASYQKQLSLISAYLSNRGFLILIFIIVLVGHIKCVPSYFTKGIKKLLSPSEHICNSSTLKVEEEGPEVEASLGYNRELKTGLGYIARPCLKKQRTSTPIGADARRSKPNSAFIFQGRETVHILKSTTSLNNND
jgi:hypothetical protein